MLQGRTRNCLIHIKSLAGPSRNSPRYCPEKERAMSKATQSTIDPGEPKDEPVPVMQQLLDNPFLLLFLGVMIPMVVYTVWGVFDILTVPLAK
jgi:hypothetical protein